MNIQIKICKENIWMFGYCNIRHTLTEHNFDSSKYLDIFVSRTKFERISEYVCIMIMLFFANLMIWWFSRIWWLWWLLVHLVILVFLVVHVNMVILLNLVILPKLVFWWLWCGLTHEYVMQCSNARDKYFVAVFLFLKTSISF